MPGGNKTKQTYLTVVGGLICQKLGETTEREKAESMVQHGARKREVFDNKTKEYKKTVFELTFTEWSGFITGLEIRSSDFGTQANVTIEDDEGKYILCLNMAQGYGQEFMRTVMNVDFSKEVRIETFIHKEKSRLKIVQDGDGLPWWISKEDDHGYPQPTSDLPSNYDDWSEMDKAKYNMVKAERIEFYKELIITEISSKINFASRNLDIVGYYSGKNQILGSGVGSSPPPHIMDDIPPNMEDDVPSPEDDLPF